MRGLSSQRCSAPGTHACGLQAAEADLCDAYEAGLLWDDLDIAESVEKCDVLACQAKRVLVAFAPDGSVRRRRPNGSVEPELLGRTHVGGNVRTCRWLSGPADDCVYEHP
jgi:hypothetical protein